MRSACDNATCPDDDRFKILLEQIGMLEKDREIIDDRRASKVSRFGTDMTNNREDHKRIKKIKRDHRRTRVIRTTPLAEEDFNGNSFNTIAEQSPVANLSSCADEVATPGDDRVKDPDWGQTPLRTRSKLHSKPTFRKTGSSGNLRKTRSNSRLLSSVDILNAPIDENKF